METLELFLAAQHVFSERVHAIEEDQWRLETPNPEWDVARLVSHLIEERRFAAPLLHGQDVATAAQIVAGSRSLPVDGGVGANLAEEWDEAAVESADAFSADGALDRTVALSRGVTAVRSYIAELTLDLVVHGWDLAQAIDFDTVLPEDVVVDAYDIAQQLGDLSDSDMFDEPVPVPDDAPTIDKLVALTGRDPR